MTIEQRNKNIVSLLNEFFPKIILEAEEKIEDINRPCFKVMLGDTTLTQVNGDYFERTIPVQIVYFAKDTAKPKLECLKIQQQIEALLMAKMWEDIEVITAGYDISAAACALDINFIEVINSIYDIEIPDGEDNEELMELLNQNTEVN